MTAELLEIICSKELCFLSERESPAKKAFSIRKPSLLGYNLTH